MFKINDRIIGLNQPPYIIAELSANHNGSIERALKTISEAKKCGADAIKIQTYTAETMTINSNSPDFMIKNGLWKGYKLYDLYKWAETPYEWHEEIFSHARKIGITIFSTPFDETAVNLLEKLDCPAYKIASFEILDLPLIRYVSETGKPLIISTGMASEKEIEEAVQTARDAGCKQIALLHCISGYPTPIDQANLKQILNLANSFNVTIGLSDHTLGTTASVVAVALGVSLIEKHFTLSRQDKGPDSEFSLDPIDFKKLCMTTKEAWHSLGNQGYETQEIEKNNKIFRRSLYFIKDLEKGHVIKHSDIRRIRPGKGIAPKYYDKVLGKKIKKNVSRGQAVTFEDIENINE